MTDCRRIAIVDPIEIGVFASDGGTLRAGMDPRRQLIDRQPADNVVDVDSKQP